MASLTISSTVTGLSRVRVNEISASESARRPLSSVDELDGADDATDEPHGRHQETSGESVLPNLTLSDVLEQQGLELSASDDSAGEDAVLIVTVETSETSGTTVESTLVRGADIEALYANATLDGPGQVSSLVSNILLLKNGWAYRALEQSPLELNAGPLEEGMDNNWAPWRETLEGLYEVQDLASGLWSRLVGTKIDTSPKSHEDTSGVYRSTQVSSNLQNTSTSWQDLELSCEGVFAVSNTTLASGGHLDPNNSFILGVTNSMTERSTTFTGVARSEGGASASVEVQQEQLAEHVGDLFGSWEILEDGVTLEMRFADGSVERRLFLQAEDSGSLTIGGKTSWRNADASPDLMQKLFNLLTDPSFGEKSEWVGIMAKAERLANRKENEVGAEIGDEPGSSAGAGRSGLA